VQLLAQIPQQSQLADPLKLQQSLNQSGLFLEAKLAEWLVGMSSSPLTADLKANLLQFAQALKAQIHADVSSAELQIVLKDLLQNTHESLAKIAINQFNSLPSVDNAQQSWLLELPFFHQQAADTLQLQIQQRTEPENQAREATEHKNWAVSITLSPPDLGTIHCRVSSYDGVINTRFWSKSNDTVAIINQHLDYLHQQLEAKGLKTGFMEAHQGKPAKPDVINLALTHLLNEKV
jgi:flagellar hook-length control protein FliK